MEEKEITTTSSSGKKATKKQNPSKISASPNSEWKIIYPIYLNSKKKVSEGRKIPLSKAIENPTFNEISDILRYLGYPTEVEPDKAYSRDYTERGRVKFKLRNEKGDLIKPEIQNKRQMMLHIASLIPKLQTRQKNPSGTIPSGKKEKKEKGKKK